MKTTGHLFLLSCAWVLWQNTIFLGSSMAPTLWPLDAYETKASCESYVQEELSRMRKQLINAAVKDRSITWTAQTGAMYMVMTCLPDTIDPRAPKGK
jgi:hypothetical protein